MSWKQITYMSTEIIPQGLFGKQTSDISTENSSGESAACGTVCENHITAAHTKAFIVNQMNKTGEQLASTMSQEMMGKQLFESLL